MPTYSAPGYVSAVTPAPGNVPAVTSTPGYLPAVTPTPGYVKGPAAPAYGAAASFQAPVMQQVQQGLGHQSMHSYSLLHKVYKGQQSHSTTLLQQTPVGTENQMGHQSIYNYSYSLFLQSTIPTYRHYLMYIFFLA